jgi:hypothetical protein
LNLFMAAAFIAWPGYAYPDAVEVRAANAIDSRLYAVVAAWLAAQS